MTKGVFIIAFGSPNYGYAAYNLARSIKHHSPHIQICLLHDHRAFSKGYFDFSDFDKMILLGDEDVKNPAKIKTSIYEKLPYDYNLFLDVDALCLKNLNPLFDRLIESKKPFATHIFETYDKNSPNEMEWMYWAYRNDIWEKYNLSDHKMPATQSSVQFIKKCDESKKLFEQINENLANPIPLEQLKNRWGGQQPDELYLNIALAQLNMDADIGKDALFFANKQSPLSITEMREQFYIMSLFGGAAMTKPVYKEFYDRNLIIIFREAGKNHVYKSHVVLSNKHADKKTVFDLERKTGPQVIPKQGAYQMKTGVLTLSDSKVINPELLLRNYKTHLGRGIKVTNWFNCGAIDFNGKRIFVYRMEAFPFCKYTRLGICYLDGNNNPIPSSNKVLHIHSDLKHMGFEPGLHVEDPRLFIHNDELYLSYTDGYQMAQAKINAETLEATESFYIKKPNKQRTEKNWTFFSDGENILSVYSIFPHVIYKMNNDNFATLYETEFKHNWKFGEIKGGATPVKHGENYIAFFHSTIDFENKQRQYFIGCYEFEGVAPYRPIRISKEPLLAGEKVNNSVQRINNKLFVVFPGGAIRNENGWTIFFGNNDYQCRTIDVTDELLNDNLTNIVYEKELENA
jgi:predicted GH43/DUF377 family glycosyl hydrolase